MKRGLLALGVTVVAVVAPAPAYADHVPAHLHCMTTANGETHAMAQGLTAHAPSGAFDNFHFNVHLGTFAERNPNGPLAPDLSPPFACP